jgi:hypothetical protein
MQIEPGIYLDLPEAVYHAAEGLSNSGMKHLAVSPLCYWHNALNPDRERPEESFAQRWGRAVHCRLLEPERFADEYAAGLRKEDYPDALVTDDDLKGWLTARGLPVTGKRKQERIDRIREADDSTVIWDELEAEHAALTAGKTILSASEMSRLDRLAEVVLGDPCAAAVLSGGKAEVSIFVRDPETGVMLKARMDYVKAAATIDLKTFSNSRGKPTDRAVFDAIYHEAYFQQCVFYHRLRELARQQLATGELGVHGNAPDGWVEGFAANYRPAFGFVFVESSEPFELRLVELRRSEVAGGQTNVYWTFAEARIDDAIHLYAHCRNRYGNSPWREPAKPHVLLDTDLPQLMFA